MSEWQKLRIAAEGSYEGSSSAQDVHSLGWRMPRMK